MVFFREDLIKNTRKINIGINSTSAIAGGGVTYLKNLIGYISIYDTVNNYHVFSTINSRVKSSKMEKCLNINLVSYKFPSISPSLRMFWEQFILPIHLRLNDIQILFCPANVGLIFVNYPFVVAIQNIAVFDDEFINSENRFQKFRLKLLQYLTIKSMIKAKKIIFISNVTRDNICKRYNIDLSKTAVVYHGNEDHFRLTSDILKRYRVEKKTEYDKYIFYVSNIYQYKNFYELVLAFIKIKDKIDNDIKLIMAGVSFDDDYFKKVKDLIIKNGCEDRIKFIGNVKNSDLPIFYSNSIMYVYPSTLESCGKTLIEAMGCGASIVTSNIAPMPEICDNAALYFNPNDPDDIAEKMLMVLQSDELRFDLSKRSLKRADYFSWEKTAKETLSVFEDVINCL